MGIYVFNTDVLVRQVSQDAREGSQHDFGRNIIPGMIKGNGRVYAYNFQGENDKDVPYWRDIGQLDSYFAANMEALKVCSHELDSLTGSAYAETHDIRHEYYCVTRGIIDRLFDSRGSNETIYRHVTTMALFGTLNCAYRWHIPRPGPASCRIAAPTAGAS